MPNAIKYSTTGDTLSLKEGNIFFGVGDVGKGPSSATTYYNGVTPPSGGYTVYSFNTNQTSRLSFFTAVNDASLITYTNQISGQNFTTATQCLNWYPTQTNFACVNKDYEPIKTSGLTLCLDSSFSPSYTSSGSTWYDIGYNSRNATLFNSPSYTSNKSLNFASSAYATITNFGNLSTWTIEAWVKFTQNLIAGNTVASVITNQLDGSSRINFSMGTLNGPTDALIRVGFNDGSWRITSGFAPVTGVTYYIAGTYDGSTIRQYVNGVASGGTLSYQGTPTSSGEVRLMRRWDGVVNATNVITGELTAVRVYNRALSDSEILSNYSAQSTIAYDSNAVAFINAAGITNSTQQSAINQLVLDLKSYSLWDKFSAIYPFVGGTATTHKFNLKDPRDLDAAYRIQFNGGWTHSSNGIQGDGSTGYADTFAQFNTVALPQDSCHWSTYNRSLPSSTVRYNGILEGLALFGWGGNSGGNWQIGFQNFNNTGVACATGFLIGSCPSAGNSRLYRNGSNIYSTSKGGQFTNYKFFLGAINQDGNPGFYNNTNFAFASLGQELSITNAANFNTAIQAFQTTLGRQV